MQLTSSSNDDAAKKCIILGRSEFIVLQC